MPTFDNSLEVLVTTIIDVLGQNALQNGLVLRDASGRLSFITPSDKIDDSSLVNISTALIERLGPYARKDQPFATANQPGVARLLHDEERFIIDVAGNQLAMIDRRIVGSGWLAVPASDISKPPRIVFASLKGGVGRSTALSVCAYDLAQRGQNVLAIDLDLEAPGLGDLLLSREQRPLYGVMDYLVEAGLAPISDDRLSEFVGLSNLTTSSGGRVDVVPAVGTVADQHPNNVLPKLSRSMIEGLSQNGGTESLGLRISEMIDRFVGRQSYDVVLIDSRAGLAELAAPAVLGLGAHVLLFGTAQQQTISGYASLFSALRLLTERDLFFGRSASWRLMLKPVYAKASLDPAVSEAHRDALYELFADNLYDSGFVEDQANFSINFSTDDISAPHWPLVIPFDPRYIDFDPTKNRDHLSSVFYEQTFRPFLGGLGELIAAASSNLGVPLR